MEKDVVIISVLLGISAILIAWVIIQHYYKQRQNADTQRQISDQDLLRLLHQQPDGYLSPHMLSDQTELTLNQARSRLNALMMFGILTRSANKKARYFYSLADPLQEAPDLDLSNDPFLTVEDLLQLFECYNYRISPQNLIMATGLPLAVVKREMKHFEKEGMVQMIYRNATGTGAVAERFFVLQEPYRSNPEQFRAKAGVLDQEMREILKNDNLIV